MSGVMIVTRVRMGRGDAPAATRVIDTDSAAGVAETCSDRGLGGSRRRQAGPGWDQGEGDAGHDEDQPG